MRHYTPHLQVNEQQLNRNSQDERGKEIMPFVWGISANVGILGWFLHWSRSNINFLNAHSRSIFKNRPTTVWCIDFTWQQCAFYSESFGRCSLLFKHRGRSNTPHPISTRPAVSWSTFLLYLRYHPPSRPVWPRTELHIRTFTLTQIKLLKPAKSASQPDEHAWRRSTCSRC